MRAGLYCSGEMELGYLRGTNVYREALYDVLCKHQSAQSNLLHGENSCLLYAHGRFESVLDRYVKYDDLMISLRIFVCKLLRLYSFWYNTEENKNNMPLLIAPEMAPYIH